MTGPRLALSLTLATTFVGAMACADDGFQKASVVQKRRGFAKATVSAPDPVIRWVGVEASQPETADHVPVPQPDTGFAGIAAGSSNPQVKQQYEETPPATPTAESIAAATNSPVPPAAKAPINFVTPQTMAGQCTGCAEPQCVQCQPACIPGCVQCNQNSCGSCGGGEAPGKRRRRFRLFRLRSRDGARQRTASKRRRRRWWPWLATNDMPAPQECGCASCTGVAVSQQAGVLVAPVQVAPHNSPVDRHQFTVLSEMADTPQPAQDKQPMERIEPAKPLMKKPSPPARPVPFMNLDKADDVMPTSLAKRIQRVTQRTTKAAGRQVRRASARFESHLSKKSETTVPQGFGEWTTGSR